MPLYGVLCHILKPVHCKLYLGMLTIQMHSFFLSKWRAWNFNQMALVFCHYNVRQRYPSAIYGSWCFYKRSMPTGSCGNTFLWCYLDTNIVDTMVNLTFYNFFLKTFCCRWSGHGYLVFTWPKLLLWSHYPPKIVSPTSMKLC